MLIKLKSVLKSNLFLSLLIIVVLALCPQDAWSASTVFEKVRQKAASSLKDVKLVVYILGGFGLIGFSFMAIFNKISWKWFANIAISLFLLSVMGLFIDDFTGTSEHASLLDYGDYLNNDTPYDTPGTNNEIPVSEPSNEGETSTEDEQSEETQKDECEGIDVARCELSPDACYASDYCTAYRNGTSGGSGASGGAAKTGGASGTEQNNEGAGSGSGNSSGENTSSEQNNQNSSDDLQPVWDPETQSYRLPEVEVVGNRVNNESGTGNQSSSDDLQPVWDPETQSYRLPEVEIIGDKI